ncbi:hypothetical protein GYMLUDRAFT_237334 [Collybiopsis luxurians FD-317 M1]|nr:hypothetical protein GYMLUDRAFT_237334 [Collybiopsis luxurians FD-317 M1]
MQITFFGATGPSGKARIQEVLCRDYTIVVFACSPHKLDAELKSSGRVYVIQGSVSLGASLRSTHSLSSHGSTPSLQTFPSVLCNRQAAQLRTLDSYSSVLASLQNSVAVLVLLSPADGFPHWAGGSSTPLTVTKGYRNIIRAMSELQIKRLIGIGTPSHVEALDNFNRSVILGVRVLRLLLLKAYEDVVETGKLLKTLSEGKGLLEANGDDGSAGDNVDIDWTWIRVPFLYDGSGGSQYNLGEELARAMLDELDQRKWIKGMELKQINARLKS